MTYCPMMDAVSFPIGFNVTKIVSGSDSAKSGSYCAIISDYQSTLLLEELT